MCHAFFHAEVPPLLQVSLASLASSSGLEYLRSRQVAAQLALYLEGSWGSMQACNLHQYYRVHPEHKQIINKVPTFCANHKGLIAYRPDGTGGTLSLPKHCCNFLRKCCDKKSDHQGFLHSQVPDGAVCCQHGKQCQFGHWARIEAQAIEAQAKAAPKWKVKMESQSPSESKGKPQWRAKDAVAVIPKAPDTPNSVAGSLALYLHQMGGSLRGSEIGVLYYKSFPRHKDLIASSAGLKSFCNGYDGLFAFESQGGHWRLCLASFCCHFLRGACNHKKDHQGRRHAKPQSRLVACNFRAECPHGHWRNIVEAATGTLSQVEQCESEEVELPVSQIRWCHDSIKVVFQDGQLVAMMLKQLLDGDLLLHQIPQIEVLEDNALLYAWTGNRRLWVFKEFERLRKQEVRIKVKKKVTKLPRKNQKFSTTNEGESVTFFSHKRDDSFPSMSFALAAINLTTAPTAWDVKLGDALRRAEGGLPLWKIQSMGDLGAQQNAPSDDLLNYLLSKPYLFVITQGAVDHVVSLACCLDALKILELNVDPLEIPSLKSLEGEQDSILHFGCS